MPPVVCLRLHFLHGYVSTNFFTISLTGAFLWEQLRDSLGGFIVITNDPRYIKSFNCLCYTSNASSSLLTDHRFLEQIHVHLSQSFNISHFYRFVVRFDTERSYYVSLANISRNFEWSKIQFWTTGIKKLRKEEATFGTLANNKQTVFDTKIFQSERRISN